jgi:hypothetical protein
MKAMLLLFTLATTTALPCPDPAPKTPGPAYNIPERPTAPGAPLIYSFTEEAGPDESFLLVGEGFTSELVAWGPHPDSPGGREFKPKVHFVKDGILAATIPETAYDGPIVVWAKNQSGYSEPVVLNAPNPWWCAYEADPMAQLEARLRVFGRNLARRPDRATSFVYLIQPGKTARWLHVVDSGKYDVLAYLSHDPDDLPPGEYQVWFHAGRGGKYGWGEPIPVSIPRSRSERPRRVEFEGGDLQEAINRLSREGGGVLDLPEGVFQLDGTLVVPANVCVSGTIGLGTILEARSAPAARWLSLPGTASDRGPSKDRAAVWLAGDGASLSYVEVWGSAQTNIGIAVRSPSYPAWIHGCRIEDVIVREVEGKLAENCAVRLDHAADASVSRNKLWGRVPVFLSGVRDSWIDDNDLVSVTRWGGNGEGFILGRNETVRRCVIQNNVFASPAGAVAGSATGRRMIWLSTGRGSVDLNWIGDNRSDSFIPSRPVGPGRFGGVAGTDQNVGETILFEACERIAYYGPAAGAERRSVILPAKLPPTPDDRLGNVERKQLAHDAAGNETPFWPPDLEGTDEAPVGEYFVTVLRGRGMGQTRRVTSRRGETYLLDRPWRVPPQSGSLVLVHTAFYRNHIVGNHTPDGMTGIQLWISCIENVLSDNSIERQRKPGLFLYGTCTTLASSMPMTWNRGIGPLYFNHVEGTRCDETSAGALVTSGDDPKLPIEFPRCLGNVLRHNSFVRNRTAGLTLSGGRPAGEGQPSAAILGTIAEFNLVRDALTGYHVGGSAEATLLRRNHAYFWYPVSNRPEKPVAFQIASDRATAVLELNSVEGGHGNEDASVIPEQRGPKTR